MTPEDLASLEKLCIQMGATPEQAPLMARKLQERARQIAETREITEVEAMDYLLRLFLSGNGPSDSG